MNEKFAELYSYIKGEDATDLSPEEFYAAYSNDPSKARDVYLFVKGEQMTDLTEEEFFSAYFGDVKKKVVSEQPSPELAPTPLVQEEEVMVSESPTPDGESVATETEPLVTEEIDLETIFQPQEIIPQDTRGTSYRDPVKRLGMYPEEGALERAYKQRAADIAYTHKQLELEAPALEERQLLEDMEAFRISDRLVEEGEGEKASYIEGRDNRATEKEIEAIERLTPLITEELIRKEEKEVVEYLNREFGRYGFSFRRTGIGDAMEVLASDGTPIEIDLDTWTSGGAIEEVEKLQAFVRDKLDIEERTEAIETNEVKNAIRAQNLRNKSRVNDDGTESIVLMESAEVDGKYVAYPTLFPIDPDNYGRSKDSWIEPEDPLAEAMKRGEVFYFKSAEEAEKFAEGSWKDISSVDAEADSFFNERGLDYLNYRKNFDAYEDAMNTVEFIEDAPFTREELTPEQDAEFGDDLYINGKLRGDAQKIKEEAEEKANNLRPFVNDNDYRTAREDFDTHIQKKFQAKAQKAAQYNAIAKSSTVELERVSQEILGVPVAELDKFIADTPQQEEIRKELWTMYQDNKNVQQLAADQYEVSNTYLDAKFDKDVHNKWVENWSAVSNGWEQGINNGRAAEQILAMSLGLKDIDDDASLDKVAAEIINHLQASETGKMGRAEYRYHSSRNFQEGWDAFKNDPFELAASFVSGSMSQMLPYGWKLVGTAAATGAASGALAGLAGGPFAEVTVPAGILAGGGYGLRTGFAATAFAMEYTNAVLDAGRNRGYDLMNPEELKAALQDENVWNEGAEIGLKRGIPIAVVDYLSGGLAGRVFKVGSVASKSRRIGTGLLERVTYDPAAEAAGEFAAQVSAGQDVEGKEIFAEALGGFGNNAPMAAINMALDIRSTNNVELANNLANLRFLSKESSSDEAITRWANNMERLGQISAEQNQRIQENVGLRRKAKELLSVGQGSNTSVTGASSAVEARTMELLAAQEELSSTTNRKAVFKDKIAEINNELQELATTKKLRPTDPSKGGKQQTLLAGTGVVEASAQESGTDIREGIKKYVINGRAFTREEFLNRLSDMSKSRLLKAKVQVKNDEETQKKAAKIMGKESAPIVEDVVTTEEVVVEEAAPVEEAVVYEKPTKVTSPTTEEFATVNRNDGKGTVTLTEDEYNAEMERFAPAEEVVVEDGEKITYGISEAFDIEEKILEAIPKENGLFYHGSPNIEWTTSENIDVESNTRNAPSKYLFLAEKPETALAYSKEKKGAVTEISKDSGVAVFEINKGAKVYKLTSKDVKGADTIDKLESVYDGIKEKGYDVIINTLDGNNRIILNNDIIEYRSTHKNQENIKKDAIQEPSTETVDVQEPATDSREVGARDTEGEVTQEGEAEVETTATEGEAEGQPVTEQEAEQLERELSELETQLGIDEDMQFQLEADMTNEERKKALEEQADALLNEVQPDNVETVDQPSPAQVIPITVTENTALADKVKRVGLGFLIGKKVNLVMADQLKVSDEYMGGPFFPLMDGVYGKVAWASMNNTAAGGIINGAVDAEYSVVFNMSPTAVYSNKAFRQEILKNLSPESQEKLYRLIKKSPKFNKTKKSRVILNNSTNLKEMFDLMDSKDKAVKFSVDDKIKFFNNLVPTKGVTATEEVFSLMQKNNLNSETIIQNIQEEFTKDLPLGALTTILEVTTRDGRKINEVVAEIKKDVASRKINKKEGDKRIEAAKKEALISSEQQKKEGLPEHPNYPVYVRGRAVALLNETTSFWNVLPSYRNIVDLKVAGILKSRDVYTVEDGSAFVLENPNGTRTVTFKDKAGTEQGSPVTIPATNKKSNKQIVEKLFGKAELRKESKAYTSKQAVTGAYTSAMKGASRAETVTEPTQSMYERFVERLSKAFPSVEVVTSQAEFDKLITDARAKQLVTRKNQKVYGAVYQGKLYLNPELENFNTPVHEFGHIWLNVAREISKDAYSRGMELIKDSEYVEQIKNSKEYQSVIKKMRQDGATDAEINKYILEEALATAIGDKGESFASAAQKKNFKNWLNELFEFVKKLTGISDLTAEQLQGIGLDEFLQGVVVDLMSENEVFAGAEVKSFGEQLQLMTAPDSSMLKVIQFGRSEGFSDAAIRELLKKRGFKISDINEAMVVNVDLTTKLPIEFERVEGGVQKAEQLFNEVRDKLSKFAKGKRKKIPAKKLTQEEKKAKIRELRKQNPSLLDLSDEALLKKFPEPARYETTEAPTMAEIRAKALELLRANPIFKAQKENVQLGLITSFDKTLETTANKAIQQEINSIKNSIKQRKKGIKSIKEAQRDLRKALKSLPLSKEVRAIIKAVGDINEDNSLAMIEKISEAVDKLIYKEAVASQQKKALQDVIKGLKEDAKYLNAIKRKLARLMRKALPLSNVYSKSQLTKAMSTVVNINAKNYIEQANKAFEIVEQQREKMKNAIIKDMLKMAKAKAKKERGKSTKPKSKGLDAQGQAFFQEAARVLKLVYDNDINGMIELAQELSDLDKIDAIIDKEQRGEKLTVKEQAMIDRLAAFDTFGDLRSMSLEEVINMSGALKDVRRESIARLKANRLKRAQEMEALSKESMSQIKKGFKELFTIAGVLKNANQLKQSVLSIREAFKRDGITSGVKSLYDNMGLYKLNPVSFAKKIIKENLLHLGTIVDLLDRGGTFFKDNIYTALNVMNEAKRAGVREQMEKLDSIANSISGITNGYKQIREMLSDGKLFIEGLDAEGVDLEIEAIKRDLKEGELELEDAKRRLKAIVQSRMKYMGISNRSIKEQLTTIDGQTDVDALVKSTVDYIEDVSEGYVVKGMTLTKNGMLRVYALSKNAVQREKLRKQGLTDESLAKIEEFLGPQLLEFADAIVDYLSNEYFESVNDVYSKTNDVNLDYIDNYFPTKSLSSKKAPTFEAESFQERFNAESPSALKQRVDEVSGINLMPVFTAELDAHLDSMERFKAYAEGVRKISKILALDQVSTLLNETGFTKMVNILIDNEVNPYKAEQNVFSGIMNRFYGMALGFRWMQLPKQSTSFVNAYSQYSLNKGGKLGALGPDFLGFAYDMAHLLVMFRTNLRKARGMSATFNERVSAALEGEVAGLEGGIADPKVRVGLRKWFKVVQSSPTTFGDIMGVMGYMAVYNRNIKNGMSEAEAVKIFNDYNRTQQTRRGTELSPLQVQAKKTPMLRMLTAFSSTLILQMNEIISSSAKIKRDIGDKKIPKKSDVRSLYLNMGVANVLFVAAANMFRIIQGNDDDREDVLYEMGKAMAMLNQIYRIPVMGAAIEDQVNKLEGKSWKSTGAVSPLARVAKDVAKSVKQEDYVDVAMRVVELAAGTNLDMVRGGMTMAEEGINDEAIYEMLGVGTSYQPQGSSGGSDEKKPKKVLK